MRGWYLPVYVATSFVVHRKHSFQELAFLDLKYQVERVRPGMEAETITILDGVSGQVNSGEMLALVRSCF